MAMILKQSTAVDVLIGPFLDITDGATAETGETPSVKSSKNGQTLAAKNDVTTPVSDADGYYNCELDATDTNTVGTLILTVAASATALPVRHEFQVIEEDIYDALYGASAAGFNASAQVAVGSIAANAITAAAIAADAIGASEIAADAIGASELAADAVAEIADAVWDELQSGHTTAGTFGEIATEIAAILADTGTTIPATLATIDGNVDAILVDTGTSIPADIAALNDLSAAQVNTEVDTALVDIGLDHLVSAAVVGADVTNNSIMARLVSASATADWDDFVNTTDSLQAIRDRGDAAWTTGAGGTPPQLLQSTTIATLASQTSFTLTAGSADNDAYNGAIAVITDQVTAVQKAFETISDYVGSTRTVTLAADPAIYTMAVGDTIEIMAALGSAGNAPTAGEVADAVWDEAQAAHTTAGTFGEIATETAAIQAVTNALPDGGALTTIDGNVDAILVDTGTTLPATLATIDGNIDAILIDTGATIPAQISGLNDLSAAQVNAECDTAIADAALATAATLATVDGNVDAILVDTGTSIPAQITALNDLSAAQVNAEVVDVLNVDTFAEPTGVPSTTATIVDKLGHLQMALVNQVTVTATKKTFHDAGNAAEFEKDLSDDGTTYTETAANAL